ncbi:hypothetical protein V1294_002899 [Bradyrhizobium sp. AZCC 1678]|uniref:Uncharacterized protein n=1 Tax=Bradyrhizobium algeriense TaxID=634784 RepID=A0ABU8BEV0_9BRAD
MNGNTAQRHAAARNTRRVKFLSRVPPAGFAQSTIHPNTAGENNDGATDPRRVSAASIIAIPLATILQDDALRRPRSFPRAIDRALT